MTELVEYERRIAYALERIGRGVETLAERRAQVVEPVVVEPPVVEPVAEPALTVAQDSAEVVALREALEVERAANAQMTERVRAIREKQETTLGALERRLGQATRAFEAVQAEANKLKRANADLVDVNRALVEAGAQASAHLINRAMQAELEALRAARAWEVAELAEILAGLEPIVAAHAKAPTAEGAEHG